MYPSHYSFPFSSLAFVVLGELLEIIMFKLSDDQTLAPGLWLCKINTVLHDIDAEISEKDYATNFDVADVAS